MSTANRRCIQYAYQGDTSTSPDVELWYVQVPAVDYVRQAFFGALAKLGFSTSYDPINDQAAEYGSLIVESLTQIIPPEEVTVPANSEINLAPITAAVKTGNGIIITMDTLQRNACYFLQSTAANGDKFQWRRFMAKGAWAYRLTYLRNTDSGQQNLKISSPGGVELNVTNDYYGVAARNQYFTGTFTITESGRCDIDCEITGKNGSSSAYLARMTSLELWRTADL